jgi:hypothetical protein
MFNRVFIIYCSLLVLGGCIYEEEPMPQIAYDYSSEVVQPKLLKPVGTQTNIDKYIPRGWLPAPHIEKRWTAIVIHHSGTREGNAAMFDKWHREGRHWEGVGYDFVIGNGINSGDGQIEVTFRWWEQKTGAHCGGTPGNWANRDSVGICLVGNFNYTAPTARQMQSLVELIRFLQRRYNIPKSRIYGHQDTPGYPGKTNCPGRAFPMTRLKSMLDF